MVGKTGVTFDMLWNEPFLAVTFALVAEGNLRFVVSTCVFYVRSAACGLFSCKQPFSSFHVTLGRRAWDI